MARRCESRMVPQHPAKRGHPLLRHAFTGTRQPRR
jgi:hypothetical protein